MAKDSEQTSVLPRVNQFAFPTAVPVQVCNNIGEGFWKRRSEKRVRHLSEHFIGTPSIKFFGHPIPIRDAVAGIAYDDRVKSRIEHAGLFRQEFALFATKIDVAEEVSRLATHITEVRRVLAAGGSSGKRLDFLMQELNREANTLGSKSVDAELSQAALEIKVMIEQMREQVQNIE